jgi:raffinose/stachyose/melibiose transport system permease protein
MPKELKKRRVLTLFQFENFCAHSAALMRPALGTVMIIHFITVWNDFFFPSCLFIMKPKNHSGRHVNAV